MSASPVRVLPELPLELLPGAAPRRASLSPLKTLKHATLTVARKAGLFGAIKNSSWRDKRLLILCYHGISLRDEHEWKPDLYMPPGTFFRRMEMLKTGGYQVLTLADGVNRLFNGTLPPRSVAITFDDGMYDFRRQALPILTEFGFPATVYLTTFYAEHNRPVFQLLCSYLLWKRRGYLLRKGLPGINSDLSLVTAADRARALGIIEEFAARENLSATDKDALARELADRLRLNYSDIQRERILHLVNPTEVAELYKKGVDVQLHTHRHRVPAEHSLFTEELRANSARIRSWTGETPAHFCYPDGRHSSNSLSSLRRLGIASAVTCEPGLACRRDDSLLLPRFVDTHCSSELEFESWLAGAASFLPRRRPAFRPPAARSAA